MTQATATATAKKATAKKERKKITPLMQKVTDPKIRKLIIKSVEGTCSPDRDDQGRKYNNIHIVKYTEGDKKVVKLMRLIRGYELENHKQKNITELENSKKSNYYLIPYKK